MNRIYTKIIIFTFISFCFSSCAIIHTYNNHLENNLINIIKKNPDVKEVKILMKYLSGYYIKIYFNNGVVIGVENLDSKGYGKNKAILNINPVNEYYILMLDYNKKPIKNKRELEIWSSIIGIQVDNIKDVVDNYLIIGQYVEKLIFLDDYRENADERYSKEIIDKIIRKDLLPSESIIILNEEKYYLTKRKY